MKFNKKIKSFVALIVCVLLSISIFTACGPNLKDVPSLGDSGGTNIAKLLLANERLNSSQLSNNNIFASGVQTFNNLAIRAERRGRNTRVSNKVGNMSVSGNSVEWSGFVEYNNSYSYFDNITSIITDTANRGAEFIDEAKQNVTATDCWLQNGNEKYYLTVDENAETICRVDNDSYYICKRHTDDNGKTVYELYQEQESVYERVKYIPGERYELTQVLTFNDKQELYFVADYSKGYWETVCINNGGELYNVIYTVMKDDICYSVYYDVMQQQIMSLGVMSADTKTDFFTINEGRDYLDITLKFAGFDGINKAVANKSDVDENGNFIGKNNVTVYLSNGKTLTPNTNYINDNVNLGAIHIDGLADGYVGSCEVYIQGDTETDQWTNFAKFLNENGLTCRRDWNTVMDGVNFAKEDAQNLVKYYKWNDCFIFDKDGILSAVNVENTRVEAIKNIYTDVKKDEVYKVDKDDSVNLENLSFAEIKTYNSKNVILDGSNVSIGEISLTVDDFTLFENDTSYVVAIALQSQTTNDMVIVSKGSPKEFNGSSKFTVTASLQFELPSLVDDRYSVVAFIATADGIRVSACKNVQFDSVLQNKIDMIETSVNVETTEQSSGKEVTLNYQSTTDRVVYVESVEIFTYSQFVEELSSSVFFYGTPSSDTLEKLVGEVYVTVNADEQIISGTYRMAYTVKNGTNQTNGYVYVEYVQK